MPRAVWNGEVLAESLNTVVVEGNHYFPPESVNMEFLEDSDDHSICPWKGKASYFDVVVGGKANSGAAWYYPNPKEAAGQIAGHVAFWRGVAIEA